MTIGSNNTTSASKVITNNHLQVNGDIITDADESKQIFTGVAGAGNSSITIGGINNNTGTYRLYGRKPFIEIQ